ncbi:hypothetical protein [Erythrobacter sp. F6033]|uniref:hypothetical protein n=1 Tax=Erythrobacter sp. F6033 TaxID=2926401 RepID=UPI001FF2E95D|nr:hypothetical protein [Erythrobacter sp. F6033]MCK0128411.1 hypothetical protein [Erythrobacter sp. F6033]
MLHQTCDLGPIRSVTASLQPNMMGCEAEFRLDGSIAGIKVPDYSSSGRTDNLWKSTCFEIFWQPIGGSSYREFNLSPSSQWACYDFDGFRDGMRDGDVTGMSVSCSKSDHELVLKAGIMCDLAVPAQVALNAVVEHADGGLQYWALAFAPGKPEFHSEACRSMIVDR